MLNGLDLFSGIGGLSLALSKWVRPIAYCEIDPYCQGVLLSRMVSNDIPYAPVWDNVRTLSFRDEPKNFDIITAGFPCQDISIAGMGKGLEGERSGLFYEVIRILRETGSRFLFLENVSAITCRGGVEIIKILTEMGYDCRWCIISASSVGSSQKRKRWFLLANSKGERCNEGGFSMRKEAALPFNASNDKYKNENYWTKNKSPIPGMAIGIPNRLDRVKSLGNAVVPQQAKEAFKILMGLT